jgi:hypothetical protein
MIPQEFESLKTLIAKDSSLTVDESFHVARECARLLSDENEEDAGRELVIRALENFTRIPARTRQLWADLVEATGLYPYVDASNTRGSSLLRHEYHSSLYLKDVYLHREQVRISKLLQDGRSVILSAPTSFGKSLLIQEVVASQRYNNIVIVQPTLALLDETRKKLQRFTDSYELVVSTSQTPSPHRNIFLFTGERVVEYETFPRIDFFVIDEFYKLSLARDDERAITLNQALYRLLKHTKRFYLLGPSIRSVTEHFAEATGAAWIRSGYATVAVDVSAVNGVGHDARKVSERSRRREEKEQRLFRLLSSLKEPTLVYCASPEKASRLALQYVKSDSVGKSRPRVAAETKELIDWIDENIHPKWALRELLAHGIGFHHGALPRHLGSSMVDLFNAGPVKVLFCTSTLIEGVNTTARNVVLFDEAKGKKPIDYFDYKNIVGRSGRMKIHYVGKVFQLARRPTQTDLDVEVPLFDQGRAPLELLVQLERDDLNAIARARVDDLQINDEELLAVIRKNAGISVQGQLSLFREISNHANRYETQLNWTALPRFEQLATVTSLIWQFLLKQSESRGGVSDRQLAYLARQYVQLRSVKALIDIAVNDQYWRTREPEEHPRVQRVVYFVLNTVRQWFEYRLPRLLGAVGSIQDLAFRRTNRRPGNYGFFAGQLESPFLTGALGMLLNRDVPISAVRKIEQHMGQPTSWPEILEGLRTLNLEQFSLLPYEQRKLRELIPVT